MKQTAELTLPAVFGRYLLLRRLSRGGMGEIFLAKVGEVEGFEKPIVIKTVLPDLSRDAAFVRLFIEEAQIAINLTHSNIAQVYEVGLVQGQYFLAMEYVAGKDLRALLNRAIERGQRIPPDVALYMVREVANGLAYAHRRTDATGRLLDLVHCDISPPNVLVSYEGEVKVIDFGVAKSTQQRARDNPDIGFGKFGYMAPEQLVRGAEVDRRADIYATGVLLYELLTGQRLFNFATDVDYRQVAREVTAADFLRPSERDIKLGDEFDALVMRALHTDPGQRYGSAEELRDAVQQQLYGMNPTISADTLAAFVRELYSDAVSEAHRMLRMVSQTDVEPFQRAIHDATSMTVTYAVGEPLSRKMQLRGSGIDLVPAMPAAQALPSPSPSGVPGAEGTRRLSHTERQFAVGVPVTAVRTPHWPVKLLVLGGLLLGLLLVTLVIMLWPSDPPATTVERRSQRLVVDAAPAVAQPAARDAEVDQRSADTMEQVQLAFAPQRVRRSEKDDRARRAAARRRAAAQRKRAAAKRAAAKKAAAQKALSPASIQRKFIQVRREYRKFARAYGGRFESAWQRILFANTYGKKDESKYRELDRMMNELLRKMTQARQGS